MTKAPSLFCTQGFQIKISVILRDCYAYSKHESDEKFAGVDDYEFDMSDVKIQNGGIKFKILGLAKVST